MVDETKEGDILWNCQLFKFKSGIDVKFFLELYEFKVGKDFGNYILSERGLKHYNRSGIATGIDGFIFHKNCFKTREEAFSFVIENRVKEYRFWKKEIYECLKKNFKKDFNHFIVKRRLKNYGY